MHIVFMKKYIFYIYENNCKEIHQTFNSGYDWVAGLGEIFIFYVLFYIF